jgi:hypothetical protein
MKQQSLKRWIPVVIVVFGIIWTVKQVQCRHRYVENMEADKLLSQSEKDELITYYSSLNSDKPIDVTKLSNKAKVVVNHITDHPLTAVTDNVVGKMVDGAKNDRHVSESEKAKITPAYMKNIFITAFTRDIVLHVMFAYQDIYSKSTKEPSRSEFERDIISLAMKDRGIPILLGVIQNLINVHTGKQPKDEKDFHFNDMLSMAPILIDLFGPTPLINSSLTSETKTVDLSGPLQRNVLDLLYAYFYPTPDFFTWIQKLIFG